MIKKTIFLFILCWVGIGTCFAAETETKKADAYYHYVQGAMLENQRKYDDAIHEYKQALQNDPDSSEILSKLAYLYVQTNRMDEAVGDAKKAIEKNPDNKEAYRMLGQIYLEKVYSRDTGKQDVEKALEQFEQIYRLDPEDSANLLALGQLYLQNNQPKEAAQMLAKYLELNPDSPSAVMSLSNAFQQLNQPLEALKVLEKYLETEPENQYVLQLAADLYEKTGELDRALELQRKVFEADMNNPVALRRYISLLEKSNQHAEAVKILEQQIAKDPERLDWKAMLAKSLQKAGRTRTRRNTHARSNRKRSIF